MGAKNTPYTPLNKNFHTLNMFKYSWLSMCRNNRQTTSDKIKLQSKILNRYQLQLRLYKQRK